MKGSGEPPTLIFGAGPAALVAALRFAKRCKTTIIAKRLPSADDAPRVEAVPASLLTLLLEFGIRPQELGVEDLNERRLTQWTTDLCDESFGPVAAHVERPALDLALLRAVVASASIEIKTIVDSDFVNSAVEAARKQEVRVIDATGRRALLARKKAGLMKPWAARIFWAKTRPSRPSGDLRIAALRGGFAYRLGGHNYITLGVVGRGEIVVGNCETVEEHLRNAGAEWILHDLPSISKMNWGKTFPASLQWSTQNAGFPIGDAALARDILSSQGLASAVCDALYVSAIRSGEVAALVSLRQFEQRAMHVHSLQKLIASCRFRNEASWRAYAAFLMASAMGKPDCTAALRAEQIVPVWAQDRNHL